MASLVRGASRIALNKNVLQNVVKRQIPCVQQVASISSKAWRELNNVKRLAPYDYKNKNYKLIDSWFDKTTKRFDENSKVNKYCTIEVIANPKMEISMINLSNPICAFFTHDCCLSILDHPGRRANCSR